MLVSVGDCVDHGLYRVHSRFKRVVNFVRSEVCLTSIVHPEIGAGPQNVVVEGVDLNGIHALFIDRDKICVNGQSWSLPSAEVYHSKVAFSMEPLVSRGEMQDRLVLLRELIQARASDRSLVFLLDERDWGSSKFDRAMAARLRRATQALLAGGPDSDVARLRGTGWGLTPCGDDFMVGCFAALQVCQMGFGVDYSERTFSLAKQVDAFQSRGNLISDATLRLAAEGHYGAVLKAVMNTFLQGNAMALEQAVLRLLRIGASSGADTATGLYLMIENEMRRFAVCQ